MDICIYIPLERENVVEGQLSVFRQRPKNDRRRFCWPGGLSAFQGSKWRGEKQWTGGTECRNITFRVRSRANHARPHIYWNTFRKCMECLAAGTAEAQDTCGG